MASTSKKRPKPNVTNPNRSTKTISNHDSSSSSYSFSVEPPTNFFPSKSEFLRLATVVVIAASVAFTCNFAITFVNRQPKPFCDSNADLDDFLHESCEPCPRNGECYEGKLECLRGYRKHGKSCVEDGFISETARKLSDLVEIRVCEAYAQYLCEGTGAVWVKEEKLWNDIDEFKLIESYGMDSSVYTYAKERALETVHAMLETRTNSQGVKELKCPDLLVERCKPITCYVRQWIAERALILFPLCALLIGGIWLFFGIHRRRYLSDRAEQLYNQVCDILEDHALTSRSSGGEAEPWVVASWLRDHLLLPKERKQPLLWKKVEELVQEDSRLDRYPKLVKGESKVVWEWQVEGCLSSSRKKRKVEERNLKLSEDKDSSSGQQFREPKSV